MSCSKTHNASCVSVSNVLHHTSIRHATAWCGMLCWCCAVPCRAVPCCAVPCRAVPCHMALYGMLCYAIVRIIVDGDRIRSTLHYSASRYSAGLNCATSSYAISHRSIVHRVEDLGFDADTFAELCQNPTVVSNVTKAALLARTCDKHLPYSASTIAFEFEY